MDIDFIIFFVFIFITALFVDMTDDGIMLIVYALFFGAIFANTQSTTPIFFSNAAYLGFGTIFNTFWLALCIMSFAKSMFIANNKGLLKSLR